MHIIKKIELCNNHYWVKYNTTKYSFHIFVKVCTKDELHILAVQSMQSGRRESLEGITDDAFCRILPSTKVTFLANKYKFVFVLDFSPSAVAVVSRLNMFFDINLTLLLVFCQHNIDFRTVTTTQSVRL